MNVYRIGTTPNSIAAIAVGLVAIVSTAAIGWGQPQLGTTNREVERVAQYDPPIEPGVPDESPGSGSRCRQG